MTVSILINIKDTANAEPITLKIHPIVSGINLMNGHTIMNLGGVLELSPRLKKNALNTRNLSQEKVE